MLLHHGIVGKISTRDWVNQKNMDSEEIGGALRTTRKLMNVSSQLILWCGVYIRNVGCTGKV